jgi:hypothetical protein
LNPINVFPFCILVCTPYIAKKDLFRTKPLLEYFLNHCILGCSSGYVMYLVMVVLAPIGTLGYITFTNKGYNIYRSVGSSDDSLVTVTVANATSWTDSNVIATKTYYYAISPFDAYSYGLFATASTKAVAGVRNGLAGAVGRRGIQCRNGIVTVGVDRAMRVSVLLFDLTGKKISVAYDAFAAAGIYRVLLVAAQVGQLVLVRVQRGDAMQTFEALAPAKGTWSR